MHKTSKESKLGNPDFGKNDRQNYGIHKFETNRGDWMSEIDKEMEETEKNIAKHELELEKEELERERREMLRQQLEELEQQKEDLAWEKQELEHKLEEERERRMGMMQPPEPTEPVLPKIREALTGDIEKAREFGLKVGTALVKVPPTVTKVLETTVKKKEEKKKSKTVPKGVAG